ncbi:hypothetical protein DFH29DRAFT_981215 [Suillus ampliporus]|nr:hypothetical protein DFH29DRAFT_981215 [Suillus ampliporus]
MALSCSHSPAPRSFSKLVRLSCPFADCGCMFMNKSGLTKHTRTQHSRALHNRQSFHQAAPRVHSPSPEARADHNHPDFGGPNPDAKFEHQDDFVPEDGSWVELGPLFRAFHPSLTGLKCDADGNFIDQNAPQPPRTDTSPNDWTPYESRITFEMAEFLFSRNQTSAKQIDTLLDLWAALLIKHNDAPPFTGHCDLYNTIDATPLGDVPWETFSMSYNEIEYVPYRDYTAEDKRCFKNFFSGDWTWGQADIIAQNEETHGSSFVPLIIGSDKTTVSVATGHTEYHPLYMSIGNIFNSTRHAHHNGVVLVGFLAIPKTTKEHAGDTDYCNFRRQMAIKPYMNAPDVAHFPDGHFHRVIYGLGPYIADYPEQVLLSGVVQGWCPKCLADRRDLDGDGPCLRQCEKHRELLTKELKYGKLWEEYGIVSDVVPFMNDYPRADIHELISPDILHQIIKGAFKDHLVDWVESYLKITHSASHAVQVMDDIDNSAFLDFCYIVRCDTLTEDDLLQLQDALHRFHRYQEIFKTTGVTLNFSLPRQHSLNHYLLLIWLFGAPNGLCSSITESKHIKAMLLTNQRLDKLAAARVDFQACGMLRGSCLSEALHKLRKRMSIEGEVGETVDGPTVEAHVELAATPRCRCDVHTLGDELKLPNFPQMIQEFLHDQTHATDLNPPVFDPTSALLFSGNVSIFNSAAASFYAPSDLSGSGGMRCEHIRAVPSWRGGAPRHDCVFVNMNTDADLMNGLAVAQVLCFFSFNNRTSFFRYTGMYVIAPATLEDDTPDISIIHIDCIFRAAHLIPVYGSNFLPRAITIHDSYDVFRSYFVNKYADHHAFEIA